MICILKKEKMNIKTHPILRVMEISTGFLRGSNTVEQRDQTNEEMAMKVL